MREVDIVIIGAGSAALFALPKILPHTKDFLVINGGYYGTTCARMGCMPSKALIQVAEDFHRRGCFLDMGVQGAESLRVDIPAVLAHVRKLRDGFVNMVLSNALPRLEGRRIDGYARFVEPRVVEVNGERIKANKFIIATGSRPIIPAAWDSFRDRILTTDELFEQANLPSRMAVLGLGVIGLELGQALSRLGVEVVGIDLQHTIGGIQDPDIAQAAIDAVSKDFPLWLGEPAQVQQQDDGRLLVTAGERSIVVDKILASLGRRPNVDFLGLENLGIVVDKHGMPPFNPQTMQISDLPVFIAGDANGDRALLHEAGDEGSIAGFNVMQDQVQAFQRKVPFAITFSDPNIVSVGERWSDLKDRTDVVVGARDFATQGRAKVMLKNQGLLHLYAEKSTGRLLGAEMAIPKGEHLGHLLSWAMQQQRTVWDLLKMPFYHPVLEEGLQNALYDLADKLDNKPSGLLELDNAL